MKWRTDEGPVKKQEAYFGFRLHVEEKGLLHRLAAKQRVAVSELLRFLIREEARKAGVK